jgi:nucleoside-diphosphate-sugar epimerase
MPRILVTGGSGFLGGHLADAFTAAGWEVRTLDVEPSPVGGREHVQGDVRDTELVARAMRGCDAVVDNAALVPVTRASEAEYRSVNVDGCRTTLDAAQACGAYVLHISSSAIYGVPAELPVTPSTPFAPFEPYGRSKAEADRLVSRRREAGLGSASLRPRTLLGPGRLGLFDVIFSRVRAGQRVPMFGRGLNRVQMCDVGDFCAAALSAVTGRIEGDFNIGSASFGTVRSDIEGLIRHAGTGARVQPVPVPLIRAILEPLDLIGRSPFNEWHWRSAPASFFFDLGSSREGLGWEPSKSNLEALVDCYEQYLRREGEAGSVHQRPLKGTLARLLRG